MAFYLAVDVGGTKTDYLLADETRELARVRGATIKRMRTDAHTAAANLEEALSHLEMQTGISMADVKRTCIGTAGESVPLVRDWLLEAFANRVSGELILIGDVEIALDAAFQGGSGVLAMAGTGSNVAGRTVDGRLTTAGGWGPALADQGSGHRIGMEGLRAAFLAEDEDLSSLLLDAVMEFWGVASVDRLVEYANGNPAPDFSRLTDVIVRCAEQGDKVAAGVLRKEGEDLAWLVRLVVRRLQLADLAMPHLDRQALPDIACTGSILEKVHPVREALIEGVRKEFPGIHMIDGVIDPLLGAVWRARRAI